MDIVGLGTEIVRISKLEVVMTHKGSWDQASSEEEQKICRSKERPVVEFAMMWAAKEAYIKATGNNNLEMNQIHISYDDYGNPVLKAASHQYGAAFQNKVSMSFDGDYAVATVIVYY